VVCEGFYDFMRSRHAIKDYDQVNLSSLATHKNNSKELSLIN
jgi:hypothetical protein